MLLQSFQAAVLTTLWRLSPSIFLYTKPSTNPGGVLRKAALSRTASRNATLDSSGTMNFSIKGSFGFWRIKNDDEECSDRSQENRRNPPIGTASSLRLREARVY